MWYFSIMVKLLYQHKNEVEANKEGMLEQEESLISGIAKFMYVLTAIFIFSIIKHIKMKVWSIRISKWCENILLDLVMNFKYIFKEGTSIKWFTEAKVYCLLLLYKIFGERIRFICMKLCRSQFMWTRTFCNLVQKPFPYNKLQEWIQEKRII